jgi:hypothetical protein
LVKKPVFNCTAEINKDIIAAVKKVKANVPINCNDELEKNN